MDKLYELKEKLMKELEDYSQNGKFSREDVESIKYMASAVDHLCNIMDGDEEYSSRYPMMDGGRAYRRSYSRKRDAMGRYTNDGYSRHDLADKLRELMEDAPDEQTRMEIKRLADRM